MKAGGLLFCHPQLVSRSDQEVKNEQDGKIGAECPKL